MTTQTDPEYGTFIVAMTKDGEFLPAAIPRIYETAAQARAVARKMAEGHNECFTVLKAVGRADPLPPKKVESFYTTY
jgi:hypothetical protein